MSVAGGGGGGGTVIGSTRGGGGGKEVMGSNIGGTGRRTGGGVGADAMEDGDEGSLMRLMTFSESCKEKWKNKITKSKV